MKIHPLKGGATSHASSIGLSITKPQERRFTQANATALQGKFEQWSENILHIGQHTTAIQDILKEDDALAQAYRTAMGQPGDHVTHKTMKGFLKQVDTVPDWKPLAAPIKTEVTGLLTRIQDNVRLKKGMAKTLYGGKTGELIEHMHALGGYASSPQMQGNLRLNEVRSHMSDKLIKHAEKFRDVLDRGTIPEAAKKVPKAPWFQNISWPGRKKPIEQAPVLLTPESDMMHALAPEVIEEDVTALVKEATTQKPNRAKAFKAAGTAVESAEHSHGPKGWIIGGVVAAAAIVGGWALGARDAAESRASWDKGASR